MKFALYLALPLALCAQTPPAAETKPAPPPPNPKATVYFNPRSGPDDPRIGLKGGLYDAGEAAFGLQKVGTLPKPPGFAPGNSIPAPAPPLPSRRLPGRNPPRLLPIPTSTVQPIPISPSAETTSSSATTTASICTTSTVPPT